MRRPSRRHCLERANLGRLRLQHWEAEAPNAIMGWTMFQPRREQWTRQRYQRAPRKACAAARKLENSAAGTALTVPRVVRRFRADDPRNSADIAPTRPA